MNRLKRFLSAMEKNETAYTSLYEGPFYDPVLEETLYDPTYWQDDIAYRIERTHKQTLDKPCITIQIPFEKLGIEEQYEKLIIADVVLRAFGNEVKRLNEENNNKKRTDKENGAFYIFKPGNEVLIRNATYCFNVDGKDYIAIKILVQLPIQNHKKAMRMLCVKLPQAVEHFLMCFDKKKLMTANELYCLQRNIRKELAKSEYCAFVANGSILPRASRSNGPLRKALPFQSPEEDEITLCDVRGMGIKRGVTVITGGGYSGKSTLLDALSAGIYNHVEGDGRELVLIDESAMKISAEDGRSVKAINIYPFIKWIPGGDPHCFSCEHASGSTSQAANIIEAINFGAKVFLIDEDKSATNFMIQDATMKKLITKEPITPFTERVRELHDTVGISTILVIGGSSEYLLVADQIIMMNDFVPENITHQVKDLSHSLAEIIKPLSKEEWYCKRIVYQESFSSYPKGSGRERLKVLDIGLILFGEEKIDARAFYNSTGMAQLNAVAFILRKLAIGTSGKELLDIETEIEKIFEQVHQGGLDSVFSTYFLGDRWLELPRKNEIWLALNRMAYVSFMRENKKKNLVQ